MANPEKEKKVAEIADKLSKAEGLYLADCKGLNVEEISDLRNQLRDVSVEIKVVKNKLYPPHRSAILQVDYGKGINKVEDIISFLDTAGAFVVPVSGKEKAPVVYVPSRKKNYTKTGLKKIIHDSEVQGDMINLIRHMEAPE